MGTFLVSPLTELYNLVARMRKLWVVLLRLLQGMLIWFLLIVFQLKRVSLILHASRLSLIVLKVETFWIGVAPKRNQNNIPIKMYYSDTTFQHCKDATCAGCKNTYRPLLRWVKQHLGIADFDRSMFECVEPCLNRRISMTRCLHFSNLNGNA